jgi:hypothetical protein
VTITDANPQLLTIPPCGELIDSDRLTVVDRWIPLVTVAYGTWVARLMRTTTLAWQHRLQLRCWVRPVLGDHRFVGEPRRRRGSWFSSGWSGPLSGAHVTP